MAWVLRFLVKSGFLCYDDSMILFAQTINLESTFIFSHTVDPYHWHSKNMCCLKAMNFNATMHKMGNTEWVNRL